MRPHMHSGRLHDSYDDGQVVARGSVEALVETDAHNVWICIAPPGIVPGDGETDVACVRLEVWHGAVWLRGWKRADLGGDPTINYRLYNLLQPAAAPPPAERQGDTCDDVPI